jgi:GntR family transcriptional regulator
MEDEKKRPLYFQVKEKILKELEHSPYYSPLPGERELCETYNVSRPTVRKALKELEDDNMIVTLRGKGSFYLGNRIYTDRSGHDGITFYKSVKSSGQYTKSKVLVQNVEPASKDISKKLQIEEESSVFHLERLRYIGEELYSLTDSYISYDLCSELLQYEYSYRSLHATLEQYGIKIIRAKKVLEIKPASFYEAMHLQISEGNPISVMETISYDEKDQVIEVAISKSLAYKTRYEMEVYN